METTEEVAALAVAVRGHGGQWGPVQGTAEERKRVSGISRKSQAS